MKIVFELILSRKIKVNEDVYNFVINNIETLTKTYNKDKQMFIIRSIIPFIDTDEKLQYLFDVFLRKQSIDNICNILQALLDAKVLIKTYDDVLEKEDFLNNLWDGAVAFCTLYFINDIANENDISKIQKCKSVIKDYCLQNKKYFKYSKSIITNFEKILSNVENNKLLEKEGE